MSDDNKHDQSKVRETNQTLIGYALEAIQKMSDVADATEHPRAYEVLFKGIKDAADINNSILDNQKKAKEIEKADKPQGLPDGQQPQVLALTTEELLRSLQAQGREEKDVTPKEDAE